MQKNHKENMSLLKDKHGKIAIPFLTPQFRKKWDFFNARK